jgi:hypothetical protein
MTWQNEAKCQDYLNWQNRYIMPKNVVWLYASLCQNFQITSKSIIKQSQTILQIQSNSLLKLLDIQQKNKFF